MPELDFPFWISHRGAGKLAPENTLAAFRVGSSFGYSAFECDVKLSRDGELFLLHDSTLSRTTNARKDWAAGTSMQAGDHDWLSLARLDAGAWHSRAFAGESMPTLAQIAAYCQANGARLNIEIKPIPGMEEATGAAVANAAARLWQGRSDGPLLSSFRPEALAAAQAAQPQLARGLLVDTWRETWIDEAQALGCKAVIFNYALWTPERVAITHLAKMKALSYTVNDESVAQWLVTLGTDGIITDRVDLFSPAA